MRTISPDPLNLNDLFELVEKEEHVELSSASEQLIVDCRNFLDKYLESRDKPTYGINTGFGSLCNVEIDDSQLEQLQENLVLSHACGTGEMVPVEIARIMLFLKIHGLSLGHSGVQKDTIDRMIELYNNDWIPVIYQQGSLGASGDLAPLAHLTLPLLARGECWVNGEARSVKLLYRQEEWSPIRLKSKEGLALLNGTQFMNAYAVWSLVEAQRLSYFADVIGAISLDAFDGRIEPFEPEIHMVRPHRGQLETAHRIKEILEGSEILTKEKKHVQDPYSFRCIPQVHGATKDALRYIQRTILNEVNAVTDNPTIFPAEGKVISGGNFHGQPLALVLDHMAIAVSELGSISERRTFQLIGGQRGLPEFLFTNKGLNSGFMIPQYTAASIASQNKQLCTPASVDSIVSSNGQEDHVSMGANAATKCYKVMRNVRSILAIELLNAAQAIDLRRPAKSSEFVEGFLEAFRQEVPFLEKDDLMHDHILAAERFLDELSVDADLIQ
jgi:histidine ammonia-lyase